MSLGQRGGATVTVAICVVLILGCLGLIAILTLAILAGSSL